MQVGQDPVTDGLQIFAYVMLMGALAAFIYDFYAGVSYLLRLGKVGTSLGDVLYWLLVLPLLGALMLVYNQGEMRFFLLLGLLCGAGIYFLLFRRRLRSVIIRLLQLLVRLVQGLIAILVWLVTIVLFPFRLAYQVFMWPWRMLKNVLVQLGGILAGVLRRITPAPVQKALRRVLFLMAKIKKGHKKPPPPGL